MTDELVKVKNGEPYEYDAGGTYKKIMERERGPRNIPANVMNRLQAQLMAAIQNDPRLKASAFASHVGEVDAYMQMSAEDRAEYARTRKVRSLLIALKVVEEETDVLDVILQTIRTLDNEEEFRTGRGKKKAVKES